MLHHFNFGASTSANSGVPGFGHSPFAQPLVRFGNAQSVSRSCNIEGHRQKAMGYFQAAIQGSPNSRWGEQSQGYLDLLN